MRRAVQYLRAGQFRPVVRALARRFYSDDLSLGLRRDASMPFEAATPALPLKIRPIEAAEDAVAAVPSLSEHEVGLEAIRMLRSGLGTCYAAFTPEGEVCFIQFLVDSSQNAELDAVFNGVIQPLEPDEALLEAAFSPLRYRGRGIMLQVLPELAAKAVEQGVRRLILYASASDERMLKACKWCGFHPSILRRTSYLLFKRRLSFTPLPEGTPYPFEVEDWDGLLRPS